METKHLSNLEFESLGFQMNQADFSILALNDSAKSELHDKYYIRISIVKYFSILPENQDLVANLKDFPNFREAFQLALCMRRLFLCPE